MAETALPKILGNNPRERPDVGSVAAALATSMAALACVVLECLYRFYTEDRSVGQLRRDQKVDREFLTVSRQARQSRPNPKTLKFCELGHGPSRFAGSRSPVSPRLRLGIWYRRRRREGGGLAAGGVS